MNIDETLYTRIEHEDGRIEFVPKVAKGGWVPKEDETFWFVSGGGNIGRTNFVDGIDDGYIPNHNVFRTEAIAKKASALMRRRNAIIRACLEVDPEFEPDWSDGGKNKWSPSYDHNKGKWIGSSAFRFSGTSAHTSTPEKCIQACALLTAWGVK